ncbi:MAG TPA: dolichyl-phosphate beta-glucosyltransferase [Acidobacteriota bacterium]
MNPDLSVVIPAYNEAERLPASLSRIRSYFDSQSLEYEIVIVDDGSVDGTLKAAEEFRNRFARLKVLANDSNRGKGFSARRGFLEAGGDLVLLTDADLSSPIEEFEKLRAGLEGHQGAIGSRALADSDVYLHQSFFRELSGKFFNLLMRLITGLKFRDTQCGFKLFRREPFLPVFHDLRIAGFAFDVEVLFLAKKRGLRVAEIPVRWGDVEGTRVGLLPGARSFLELLAIRLRL